MGGRISSSGQVEGLKGNFNPQLPLPPATRALHKDIEHLLSGRTLFCYNTFHNAHGASLRKTIIFINWFINILNILTNIRVDEYIDWWIACPAGAQ